MATNSRLRAALATVEAADAAKNLTELPNLLLPALMDAVAADSALWTELDPAAGPLPRRIVCHPEPLLDEESGAALERHVPDFPLTRHTRPGGPGTPVRRSDLQTVTSFRSCAMYADVVRQLGIDEMVAMALVPGRLHVCVALNRVGRDFSEAEVDLLTQLRPLLTRRLARLAGDPWPGLAGGRAGPGGDPVARRKAGRSVLTERQLEVLDLVAGGLTDVAIAHRLGCSPRTVDKHLEHAYRRLGVSCRTAAMAAVSAAST
jgi:DNA-binding CsgD family transcriptional regulator